MKLDRPIFTPREAAAIDSMADYWSQLTISAETRLLNDQAAELLDHYHFRLLWATLGYVRLYELVTAIRNELSGKEWSPVDTPEAIAALLRASGFTVDEPPT